MEMITYIVLVATSTYSHTQDVKPRFDNTDVIKFGAGLRPKPKRKYIDLTKATTETKVLDQSLS